MKVFIDTSAFCALTIPADHYNLRAKEIYDHLSKQRPLFCTSDYVLDEVYTLLKRRSSHAVAVTFMDRITKSSLTVMPVTGQIFAAAKRIFKRYDDRRLSFTDCTSFALINMHRLDAVFAFDVHFCYYRYPHSVQMFGYQEQV